MSVAASPQEKLDLRCPNGPKQLLAKVVRDGDHRAMVDDRTLMELACRDCTREQRRLNPTIRRVVHRFNVLGDLVESIAQAE